VGGQPVRQGLGLATFQRLQWGASLAVDQHRAVVLATFDREVIDPEHAWGRWGRVWDGHDQAQQGRPARRRAQHPGKPRSGPPGQRHRNRAQHRRSSGVRRAYRLVRPSTCSANVAAGQPGASQKNRRTASRIITFWPPIAASASRR